MNQITWVRRPEREDKIKREIQGDSRASSVGNEKNLFFGVGGGGEGQGRWHRAGREKINVTFE